jgi:hypothetical protein
MMTTDTTDDLREKEAEYEAEYGAYDRLTSALESAERIGETRLSKLFHEARTTRKGHWKTVSAFCRISESEESDEAVVEVDHLDKLSEGRWRPEVRRRYDLVLSVPVRPFMEADTFRSYVRDDIRRAMQSARQSQQRAADRRNAR